MDEYDDYQYDEFEAQFADELELLQDQSEEVDFDKPSSRRSLHFATPAKTQNSADISINGAELCPIPSPEVTPSAKRKASQNESPPDGRNALLLPSPSPAKPPEKRARTEPTEPLNPFDDDFDIQLPTASSQPLSLGKGQLKTRIPEGDFVSVTGLYGDRFYMDVLEEEVITKQIEATSHIGHSVNLLSVPYYALKEQVLTQKDDALQRDSDEIRSLLASAEDEMEVREVTTTDPNNNLWVEKYSPHRYTELLSDESVNRSLLQWIKLWDHVVFHKDLPTKPKAEAKPNFKDNKKFVKKSEIEVSVELDKYKRPLQKVVLLCGPPGLGKTTLAHIIARHAGYKVIEMNASDDRSAEAFKTTLESSTQMKSVLGDDPRPNCLVIDEIDGAPVAAINVLLATLKYPEGATKKNKNTQILLRPIICICNDLYVPALRELKKVALVLNFPQTLPTRLASRLYEVAGEESLKADMNSLLALCEKTDNDIRSCLNTLQFLRRRHSQITMRLIQQASVGQKDSHKTLFSVWHDIFTIRRPKRARLGAMGDEQERKNEASRWQQSNTLAARFEYILGVIQAAGDYHKVNQGLYENYLEAKSKDPRLHGMVLSTDWLCFVDHINQYISRSQDYSPMKYIPYLGVTFHLIYGSNTYPKIQYPHTEFEQTKALSKSTGLISGLLSDMIPGVRRYFDPSVITLDLLPSLLLIIQPTLRPVNTQLYSSREKADLLHLVNIMIGYNLTYKQEKQLDAQYTYVLEPNMEEIVRFEGQKAASQKPLTYAAKQLIAREIDMEKMKRSEVTYGTAASADTKPGDAKPVQNTGKNYSRPPPKVISVKEDKPVRNFFGQIVKKDPKKVKEEKKKNLLETDVWFHFKEGFSNAVRRNVRVKDFL